MRTILMVLSIGAAVGLGHSAFAADISSTFTGTMTQTAGSNSTTIPDQLVLTTHTDANGSFLPQMETEETYNGHVINTEFRNPVALPDGSGYLFEMFGKADGGDFEDLGQFTATGMPGAFTSVTFDHTHLIGDSTLFQTGTGTTTNEKDGSVVLTRNEQIVDVNNVVQFTVTSTVTHMPVSIKVH